LKNSLCQLIEEVVAETHVSATKARPGERCVKKLRHTLRSKRASHSSPATTAQAQMQVNGLTSAKCLELPATRHAAKVAEVMDIVTDTEARGLEVPHNDRVLAIYQLLAARAGP
jgi:hypothetical protein